MKGIYDVVVIGAGLAGLCAGAYVARDGCRVLVCEQAERIGGYFRCFSREGFTFDTGLKAVENAGMLLPMLRQLKLADKVKLRKCTSAMVLPNELITLRNINDIKRLYAVLGNHFPDQRQGLAALLRQSDRIATWVNAIATVPNPLFEEAKDLLPKILPWLIKNLPAMLNFRRTQSLLEVPMTTFLSRYVNDAALVRVLTELFFEGTPALFGMGYSRVYMDYYYADGGMQSLTDVLADYIREKGGVIQTGARVKMILVDKGKATGVELTNGCRISASYVVAASDMKHTFLDMVDPRILEAGFRTQVAEARIGESAACVFLATDMNPKDLPVQGCAHLYYLPDYQGIEPQDRMDEDFFARSPLEISIPCLNDPALAPPGKSGIIISALAKAEFCASWNTNKGEATPAYYALKESVADQIVKSASRIFPGLAEHILFRQIATPYTYARYTLNSGGSICGWTYDRQTTFHRGGLGAMQKSMLTPIDGLLQAGHWTVYPGGAPVCILSGRLAADYISRRSKKEAKSR